MMRGLLASLNASGRASASWMTQEYGWWIGGAAVERSLLDLGLDGRKLPPQSHARLRRDVGSIGDGARGPHSRRIALRFFTWYVMEAADFTPQAMKGEGAVANALTVIQHWCRADPELVKTVAPDFHRLRAHLFQTVESSAAPRVRLRLSRDHP